MSVTFPSPLKEDEVEEKWIKAVAAVLTRRLRTAGVNKEVNLSAKNLETALWEQNLRAKSFPLTNEVLEAIKSYALVAGWKDVTWENDDDDGEIVFLTFVP